MAVRLSTFVGLSAVVLVVGLTLTAFALSLLAEQEARRKARAAPAS